MHRFPSTFEPFPAAFFASRAATNLSCSTPPVGTLDAFDHIILTSIQMWGGPNSSAHATQVAELLGRTALSGDYSSIANTTRAEQYKYAALDI